MRVAKMLLGADGSAELLSTVEKRLKVSDTDALRRLLVESEVKLVVRSVELTTLSKLMEILEACAGFYTTRGIWKDLFLRYENRSREDFWVGLVQNPEWKSFGELIVSAMEVLESALILEVCQKLDIEGCLSDGTTV